MGGAREAMFRANGAVKVFPVKGEKKVVEVGAFGVEREGVRW